VPLGATFAVYILQGLGSSDQILAASDPLGVSPRLAQGSGPRNIAVQLGQATIARLSWEAVPDASAYVVVPVLPAGQSPIVIFPPQTTAVHDTVGGLAAYIVAAVNGSRLTGNSDGVIAVPGQAALSPAKPRTGRHSPGGPLGG
jgi:hypothetical protein